MDEELPRLNFDPSLVDIVLNGKKTATTRLRGEKDPNSDLDKLKVGQKCRATTDGKNVFAILKIKTIQDRPCAEIDDKLAAIENCKSPDALKKLLRKFYPDISENS